MILFIHIPKTAGTSFRKGLEQTFKRQDLLFDYGPGAAETHPVIRNLYQQRPFAPKRVAEIALTNNSSVICGHFPLSRYIKVFPDADVISFVREPLQRSYSEYLHFQRHKDYRQSFEVFFNQKHQVNLQSRFLEELPSNSIVGCSEYYEQSLELIHRSIALTVPSLKLNCNRNKIHLSYSPEVIGKRNIDLFYQLNDLDARLYKNVKRNFSPASVSDRNVFSHHIRNLRSKLLTLPIAKLLR